MVLSFCFIAVTVLDAKNSGRNFVGVFSERGRAKGNESCEFLLTVLLTGVVSIVWGEQKQFVVACSRLEHFFFFFFECERTFWNLLSAYFRATLEVCNGCVGKAVVKWEDAWVKNIGKINKK